MKRFFSQVSQHNIIALLLSPSYLSFSLSVFASQVAYNMLSIILIFLVFYLTSSNFAVAMLLFTILIPQIVLSFLGGVIADKNDKKKIIIWGNFLRAAILLILFFNFESVALVYLIAFLVSVVTQFYVPAEAPIIPSLVSREKLVAANSIFGLSLFGSILVGYVLAGPAVAVVGRSGIFLLLSLVFAVAGVLGFFIPKQAKVPKRIEVENVESTMMGEFKSSFSILAKTATVIDAFFLLIVSQIIIFILATLIPGYAKTLLQIPAEDLSVVIFAPAAVGMAIAAVGVGTVFQKTKKETLTAIGVFASGIVLMLLPFTSKIFTHTILRVDAFTFVLILAFIAGIANALIFIPSQAVIQEAIPENFRSKIYGLLFALIGVFSILPILISGGIADIVGVGVVFFILGLSVIILGFVRRRIFKALPGPVMQ